MAVSLFESQAEPGQDREDHSLPGPGEVDTYHDDHEHTCEAGVILLGQCNSGRHDKNEKITMRWVACQTVRSWGWACVAERGRSDAHQTSRSSPSKKTTTALDHGYLEDKKTVSEQEAGPSSDNMWTCSHAKARPFPGACERLWQPALRNLILRPDKKPTIVDLKRRLAAAWPVGDDSAEHESQDNGFAEVPVREIKTCGAVYNKDIQ